MRDYETSQWGDYQEIGSDPDHVAGGPAQIRIGGRVATCAKRFAVGHMESTGELPFVVLEVEGPDNTLFVRLTAPVSRTLAAVMLSAADTVEQLSQAQVTARLTAIRGGEGGV